MKHTKLKKWLGNSPIFGVSVCFFLKLKRSDNTCNGNGYGIWHLDWAWFRKLGSKRLWTQKLGNGDNGERCMG